MTHALPGARTITIRRHPVVLTRPVVAVLAGLVVAAALGTSLRGASVFMDVVWVAWGFLLLRLLWKTVEWAVNYLVVTPVQLSLSSGVITRRVTLTPLARVTDIGLSTSFLGRTLGYGHLILEIAGQNQSRRVFDCIPHVNELYLELSHWIT
jgi:uncharacterized membrane protein YdbT with pleckstrin-like domain